MTDYTDSQTSRRITLKDIARETGFSINTVSRALKDKADISEPTKKVIRAAAKRMGYISNSMAGSLRSGSTKTIAVILGDISNPVFSLLVKEIDMALRPQGYSTIIINTDENDDLEREAIRSALSKSVDGIILCPAQNSEDNVRFLMEMNVPFILIGRHFPSLETDCVVWDEVQSGRIATRHLLERGHRRILMLNGPEYISSARERLEGYRLALDEKGIPLDPDLVREVSVTAEDTRAVLSDVLINGPDFSAILAFSDLIAWRVINVLRDFGKTIPDDFALVGFDNVEEKWPSPFPLTTVSACRVHMVQVMLNLLLGRIKRSRSEPLQKVVVPTMLVVRASS